ncbi:MAG TPA: DHA2 family efflux MFS transporter permease subunit [Nitrospirota bacterium]
MHNKAHQASEPKPVSKWLIALTVMLPTLMEIIDTSVANVALPHMQGSFNAGADEVTWVLTSYLVSNAIVLPMTGWLSRVFGRRRFLMTCVTLFTIASLLCGAAPNLGMMIFFRILQGAAGGALQPMSQAILFESFPVNERGVATAIFGVGAMFGPIIGPALGGWITDQINWRWIFWINIPFGVISLILTKYLIHDPSWLKKGVEKVDYWGLALLTIGIGSLQVVLDKGQREDWFESPFIIAFTAVMVIALIVLIYHELTTDHPIVNLRLFKDRNFATGNLLMFMFGFCLYGTIVLLGLMLQMLMGYNATLAGLVLAPGGVATLIMMPFVGIAIKKQDPRKITFVGLIISAVALHMMTQFNLQASYWTFVWPRVVLGFGMAMTFVPLTAIAYQTISKEEMGNATGFFNLLRNVGGSVGIAFSATMLQRYGQVFHNNMVGYISIYNPVYMDKFDAVKQGAISRGLDPSTAGQTANALIYGDMKRQAAMMSYNNIYLILGAMFIVVMPFLLLVRRAKAAPAGPMH